IMVRLRSFGVGLIHISNDGINLPTLCFLLIVGSINNYTDSKEIVNLLKLNFLFLQLVEYGVYRLGSTFDVILQAGLVEPLLHRINECFDILIARTFCLVQLLSDKVVRFSIGIFQAEIFQL